MTTIPNDLLKDPIFQLNTLLWLAQPLPDGNEIKPLFYKQKFTVYAIAPLFVMPIDLRLAAQETQIRMQDRVRPDIVLTQESNRKFAFIECKTSAFGPNSSTAEQARSLMIVSGLRSAEILGLASEQVSDSLLVFLISEHECSLLFQTLMNLQKELLGHKVEGIVKYFKTVEEYANLPRTRGTGHKIESWVKDNDIETKYNNAQTEFLIILGSRR